MPVPTSIPDVAALPGSAAQPAWLTLFNRAAFHAIHAGPAGTPVAFAHEAGGRPVAATGGVLSDGELTIGWSAPFGGLDFARPRETAANVEEAVDALLETAGGLGARTVRLRCRPASWSANDAPVQFALLNRGFQVERADLAFTIDLTRFDGPAGYLAALKSPARRALRHAFAEPFAFGEAEDPRAAYDLIAANRAARGWTLSLSWERVEQLRAAFPCRVRLFELRHAGAPVAATLVLRVSEDGWFVPAWGDAGHDLPRSPMNLLAHRVVERALEEGARLLDLGTSTRPGPDGTLRPSSGLVQFKQSILAAAELRPVLVR